MCTLHARTHTHTLAGAHACSHTCKLPQMSKSVGKSSMRAQLKSKHTNIHERRKHTSWRTDGAHSVCFRRSLRQVHTAADRPFIYFFAFSRRFRVGRHRLIRASPISSQHASFYVTKHQTRYADISYFLLFKYFILLSFRSADSMCASNSVWTNKQPKKVKDDKRQPHQHIINK